MDFNFQDFTNADFTDRDASEFNGQTIKGSCFYRENNDPDPTVTEFDIFPAGMTGATFERCNLTNVKIPPGNTVLDDCQTIRLCRQADLELWVTDDVGNPVEPNAKVRFEKLGLSIDPVDILPQTLDHVTRVKSREIAKGNE
jgi:hypothetical protein